MYYVHIIMEYVSKTNLSNLQEPPPVILLDIKIETFVL